MRKDNIRDYATFAFRKYASLGCPTAEEYRKRLREVAMSNETNPKRALILAENAEAENYANIMDIEAVNGTLSVLEKSGRQDIIKAINEIYFAEPDKPLLKKNITERAQAFATSLPADIRTIFRYLAFARKLFAELRGLSYSKHCQ